LSVDRAQDAEALLAHWRAAGDIESLDGIDCFVVDLPGDRSGDHSGDRSGDRAHDPAQTPVLWLHGFPSSSLDWRAVIETIDSPRRMLLLDFPGFGLSAKPSDYSYSLIEQADRVIRLLCSRGLKQVHLVAHDMGTSVACELLARQALGQLPFRIASLVLTNGSVYIELSRLTLSQKLLRSPLSGLYARLVRWPLFRRQIGRVVARPVAEVEWQAMWQGMQHNDGLRRMPATIGYVAERYHHYRRWTAPLARLDLPVRILWGRRDPVAVPAIAERLAATIPGAELVWLEGCGHFPMLEYPAAMAAELQSFLRCQAV
jgi:pimeloyl-ACP methyl ester carboxylesterase